LREPGQALSFRAHDQYDPSFERRVPEGLRRALGGSDDPIPGLLAAFERAHEVRLLRERDMRQRTRGRFVRCRSDRGCAPLRDEHSIGTHDLGRAHDRPKVPGIGDVIERDDQRPIFPGRPLEYLESYDNDAGLVKFLGFAPVTGSLSSFVDSVGLIAYVGIEPAFGPLFRSAAIQSLLARLDGDRV